MEGEEEKEVSANSEIRYIALEIMKLAAKSGRSFDEVAREYMENAEKLSMMISGEEEHRSPKRGESSKQK